MCDSTHDHHGELTKTLSALTEAIVRLENRIAAVALTNWANLEMMKRHLVEFESFLPEDARHVRADLPFAKMLKKDQGGIPL